MNKQEAIEKLKSRVKSHWLDEEIYGDDWIKSVELNVAIDIVNQIDEPEKPVVPPCIDRWIQGCKYNGFDLLEAMAMSIDMPEETGKWINDNPETFAKAWLFGYEVEKEKLYTVELPDPNGGGHVILCKTSDGIVSIAFTGMARWQGCKNFQLTEAEIKKDFEWAFRWAKEVE